MGSLGFPDIQTHPTEVLDLTSFTGDECQLRRGGTGADRCTHDTK